MGKRYVDALAALRERYVSAYAALRGRFNSATRENALLLIGDCRNIELIIPEHTSFLI